MDKCELHLWTVLARVRGKGRSQQGVEIRRISENLMMLRAGIGVQTTVGGFYITSTDLNYVACRSP